MSKTELNNAVLNAHLCYHSLLIDDNRFATEAGRSHTGVA